MNLLKKIFSISNEKHHWVWCILSVNIGNHVWLCQNTSILKYVNIPSNTVVAYGSVVTKSLTDENVIIAGNPAKIVKKNVNWSRD